MEATVTPVLSWMFHMGNSHRPGWLSVRPQVPVLHAAGGQARTRQGQMAVSKPTNQGAWHASWLCSAPLFPLPG